MIKLAITGNIAAGKTAAQNIFYQKNIACIDTDDIVHDLLAKDKDVIEKVCLLFAQDVKNSIGEIDRKKVAQIVFRDKEKICLLEEILHPKVKERVQEFFAQNKDNTLVVVSVPQLYEAGWKDYFDYVLLITADEQIRLQRLAQRNNLTIEEAKLRIKAQIPQEQKIKMADFVIENSDTHDKLKQKIEGLILELLKKR